MSAPAYKLPHVSEPARLSPAAYDTPGGRLWVITEADRSATTVLLPSEP